MATPSTASTPPKSPGERLSSFFDNFLKTVAGICTFGASLTFSKIISDPVVPWINYGFSHFQVQRYIAISWLCFILGLAITSFAASALSLWRPKLIKAFGTVDSDGRRTVMWWATAVSSVLFGLLMAAFIFLGLVVVAYAGPVGWAAVGATTFFGTLGFGSIIWQSPLGSNPPKGNSWRMDASKLEPQARRVSYHEHHEQQDVVRKSDDEKDVTLGMARGNEQNGYGWGRGHNTRRHSIEIPSYTEELRRSRASKNSSGNYHSGVRNF